MTHRDNITAILECYFTGFKKEIIDSACNRILEQEPCEDAISRQAVLDLAKKGVLVSNGNYKSVCKAINELPSVNLMPCEDAISREMALKECHDIVVDGERYRVIQEETLLGLPSVKPQEPKTGYWIETETDDPYWYRCSRCNRRIDDRENYCPNCGCCMFEPQKSEE